MKMFKQEEFELFVILCWANWNEICRIICDNVGKNHKIQVDWAYAFFDNIKQSKLTEDFGGSVGKQTLAQVWIPPTSDFFRLKVDAGFDINRNIFSVGIVVHNGQGRVCGAQGFTILHPGLVIGAELTAIDMDGTFACCFD